jgi:hypothetical protein
VESLEYSHLEIVGPDGYLEKAEEPKVRTLGNLPRDDVHYPGWAGCGGGLSFDINIRGVGERPP